MIRLLQRSFGYVRMMSARLALHGHFLPPGRLHTRVLPALILFLLSPGGAMGAEFESDVRPVLEKYCVRCHGKDKVKGDIDFTLVATKADVEERFDWWESVVERLQESEMPPEDEAQPSDEEKEVIYRWYQEFFVESVEARPGLFRPRRLSAVEYRNTLRSILGFDLQVNIMEAEQTLAEKSMVLKLLPLDPPGPSGFTNDTSGNPLTPLLWNQYSYIIDSALTELLSTERRDPLERIV